MKRFATLLFTFVLLAGSGSAWAGTARNVTPDEAFRMVSQSNGLYLLDVRTFGEYQQARLESAHLIPIDKLAKRVAEIPRDQPVLVYCAVGSRSAQVVNYLARQGYPEVYNLSGGIYAWANRGYPYLQGLP